MYGAGKATSLLVMSAPVEAGSIVYDFSMQTAAWVSLAGELIQAATKFDTVDTAQEPYVVKYGHFSYYPLASGRYYPYIIPA